MSSEFGNPFHPDSALVYSNEEGLEDLEEGMGKAMAAVLGTEGPLPTENPFNSSHPDAPLDSLDLDSFLTNEQRALKERMKEAREIFGEGHFFGPEEIKKAFGIELLPFDLPEIPYTPDQLREAEKQGYELILHIARDDKNQPMTALHIYHLLKEKYGAGKNSWGVTREDEKILDKDPDAEREIDLPWYAQDDFFSKESLKTEWRLEARSVLPKSGDKNYIEQTRLLRDILKEQGALTPEEEEECTDDKLQALATLMRSNWKEAARRLAGLKITQNHRRSLVEAFYGQFIRRATGGPDFRNSFVNTRSTYDWTSSCDSDGRLIGFGNASRDSACVSTFRPLDTVSYLHLLLVR